VELKDTINSYEGYFTDGVVFHSVCNTILEKSSLASQLILLGGYCLDEVRFSSWMALIKVLFILRIDQSMYFLISVPYLELILAKKMRNFIFIN